MTTPEDGRDFLDELFEPATASEIRDLPGVEDALRRGSRAKLHAALRAQRGKARSADVNEAIARAVSRRRLFWDRLSGTPSMFTLNGIGSRLYGRDEADAGDGTYVKTLYFTILYAPIVPLASYLVADAGGAGWRFFARVPLSAPHRWWRRGLLVAVAVLALVLGLGAHAASTRSDIRFVNALDVEVTTTVGPLEVRLEPGETVTRVLDVGSHHLVTRSAAGETIEELDVEVPAHTDLVAYSVLGAAAIVVEDVVYSVGPPDRQAPRQEPMLATPWLVRDGVDYVFVAPPARISMTGAKTLRHRAFVVDGGWRESVRALAMLGDVEKAATLACRVALAERDERAVAFAADGAAVLGGERMLAFGEKAVAAMPASVEAHRARQIALRQLGRIVEVRATYRAAYERDPGSATAGYLYARLLPAPEAVPILEALVAAHPDDLRLHGALGGFLYDLTRFADAVPHFERHAALDVEAAKRRLPVHAIALAGAGRVPEAARLVRSAIAPGDWDLAILCVRLARLPGSGLDVGSAYDVVALAAGRESDLGPFRAPVAAQARDAATFETCAAAVDDPSQRAAYHLALAAFADLPSAAAWAVDASDEVVRALDDVACLSIACELAGTGKGDAARRVYAADATAARTGVPFDRLAGPAAALDDPELELELEIKAVLAFAASRRATDPAERERHLARARACDVLRVVVPP